MREGRDYYGITAFDHGCITGGHTVTPKDVVWTTNIGGRWVGTQTCPDCEATRRVMQYAKRRATR